MRFATIASLLLLCSLVPRARADDTPLSADLRTAFATAAGVAASAVTEVADHPVGGLWASTGFHSILIGAWGQGPDSESALVLTRPCGEGRCTARVQKLGKVSAPALVALVDLEGDGGELTELEWEEVLEPARSTTAKRPALLLRIRHATPPPSRQWAVALLLYPLESATPIWDFTARVHDGAKSTQRNLKVTFEKSPGPVLDIVTDETRFRWDEGLYKPLK
ncbi:MAG: hypothetical protein ABIK09_11565 [Pseudomonadota bacterium]